MGQLQPKLRGCMVFSVEKREERIKLERIDFPLRSEIENDYKSTSESCEGQGNIDSSSLYPKKGFMEEWLVVFRTKVTMCREPTRTLYQARQRTSALLSGYRR